MAYLRELQSLENVVITNPINNQVLTYDGTNNIWINSTNSGGGGSTTSFLIAADSGNPETITDGNTLSILGGTNLSTNISGVDSVTINWSASITNLTDVDTITTAPNTNDVLLFNGTNWVPGVVSGSNFSFTLTDGANSEIINNNSTLTVSGGLGINAVVSASDTLSVSLNAVISNLLDVNTTGATTGNVLQFNGTNWVPGNVTGSGSDTSIYLGNGNLNSNRIVNGLNTSSLDFTGLTSFGVSGSGNFNLTTTGGIFTINGNGASSDLNVNFSNNIDISGRDVYIRTYSNAGNIRMQTQNALANTARVGSFLQYTNATTDIVEFSQIAFPTTTPGAGTYVITIDNNNDITFTTINNTPADGSETIIQAGNNVTITGSGTTPDPYIINSVAGGGGGDGVITTVTLNTITNVLDFTGTNGGFNGQIDLSTYVNTDTNDIDYIQTISLVGDSLQFVSVGNAHSTTIDLANINNNWFSENLNQTAPRVHNSNQQNFTHNNVSQYLLTNYDIVGTGVDTSLTFNDNVVISRVDNFDSDQHYLSISGNVSLKIQRATEFAGVEIFNHTESEFGARNATGLYGIRASNTIAGSEFVVVSTPNVADNSTVDGAVLQVDTIAGSAKRSEYSPYPLPQSVPSGTNDGNFIINLNRTGTTYTASWIERNLLGTNWFTGNQTQDADRFHNANNFTSTVSNGNGFIWQNNSPLRTQRNERLRLTSSNLTLEQTSTTNSSYRRFNVTNDIIDITSSDGNTGAGSSFATLTIADNRTIEMFVQDDDNVSNKVGFRASNTTTNQVFIQTADINSSTATNDMVFTLIDNATGEGEWRAASGGSSVTANNGLNINGTSSAVHLGGTLIENTEILTSTFNFDVIDGDLRITNQDQVTGHFLTAPQFIGSKGLSGTLESLNGINRTSDGSFNAPVMRARNTASNEETIFYLTTTAIRLEAYDGTANPTDHSIIVSQDNIILTGRDLLRIETPQIIGTINRVANSVLQLQTPGGANNGEVEYTPYALPASLPANNQVYNISYDNAGVATFTAANMPNIRTINTIGQSITDTDYTILLDSSASLLNVTLPLAANNAGRMIVFKHVNGGNQANVIANPSDQIEGTNLINVQARTPNALIIVSDGINDWWVLN